MSRTLWTSLLSFGLLTTCLVTPARAHISLEMANTHKSRYGDADTAIKEAPCGQAGGTRGTNIYTYEPGATITVSLVEKIPHPSYFRVAFDDDGDDGFEDPVSIDPIDKTRACPDGPTDHCGASDFYNTSAVLPNMDNLFPHIPTFADSLTPPTRTFQVTLPDVECTNCTLQIIQVMQDDTFHGPYDTTPGVGISDVYHQCIDLVLKRTGGAGTGGAPSGSAGATGMAGSTGAAGAGSTDPGPTGSAGSNGIGGASGFPGGAGAPAVGGGTAVTGTAGAAGSAGPGVGGNDTAPGAASSSNSGSCALSPAGAGARAEGGWAALAVGLAALGLRRRRR